MSDQKLCSRCDSPIDGSHSRWCRACYQAWRRERYRLNPSVRLKEAARAKANKYVKLGIIIKQPCVFCGAQETEMHHGDYSKPYDVSWVCRPCHEEFHSLETKVLKVA